jgi:hypothetical protein
MGLVRGVKGVRLRAEGESNARVNVLETRWGWI